ncbi:MAG: hypothetical protein K0S07_1047 [Chlamydiales bacterium]|jgi:hypothetical protein|nr:hypothetical protein [Chlamydiales bacterium]
MSIERAGMRGGDITPMELNQPSTTSASSRGRVYSSGVEGSAGEKKSGIARRLSGIFTSLLRRSSGSENSLGNSLGNSSGSSASRASAKFSSTHQTANWTASSGAKRNSTPVHLIPPPPLKLPPTAHREAAASAASPPENFKESARPVSTSIPLEQRTAAKEERLVRQAMRKSAPPNLPDSQPEASPAKAAAHKTETLFAKKFNIPTKAAKTEAEYQNLLSSKQQERLVRQEMKRQSKSSPETSDAPPPLPPRSPLDSEPSRDSAPPPLPYRPPETSEIQAKSEQPAEKASADNLADAPADNLTEILKKGLANRRFSSGEDEDWDQEEEEEEDWDQFEMPAQAQREAPPTPPPTFNNDLLRRAREK